MSKIHALSLKTHTETEFIESYPEQAEQMHCRGGSKFDKKVNDKQENK